MRCAVFEKLKNSSVVFDSKYRFNEAGNIFKTSSQFKSIFEGKEIAQCIKQKAQQIHKLCTILPKTINKNRLKLKILTRVVNYKDMKT